ncbi:MAG: Pvc16 family protein [Nitriliruptoraceae bacterium]
MIDELDRCLERWLRAAVPLPSSVAEIGFDPPEREWESRRSTPLVDLFLHTLAPSRDRAARGSRVIAHDGGLARVEQTPVIEAHYLVSVWGGGPAVEHDLLGRIMNLLSASRAIPPEHLSEAMRALRPAPTVLLASDNATTATDLWTALSVPPRPAVQLLVQTPAGAPVPVPANDPPSSLTLSTSATTLPAARSRRRRRFGQAGTDAVGGRVITRRGSAIIQDSGRYSVEADPDDPVTILPPEPARGTPADPAPPAGRDG